MSMKKYLETLPFFEITKYDSHRKIPADCVSFQGSPRKHPYDNEKMVLILEPFSSNTIFFEFYIKDIVSIEETPSIATESGQSLKMFKIWVKKGSFGLKYEPFEVADTLQFLKDSEILRQTIVDSEN
ncbi:MAG: hypothetical protein AB1798_03950 [Spirochaetota bacterium]